MVSNHNDTEMSLPEGFEHLEELENMDVERLQKQPLVNVFGVVKSSQPPISTRRTGKSVRYPDRTKD